MTYGVQIYATDGTTLVFDSTTAVGGVTADYRAYAAGSTGETVSYPQWAGLSCLLLDAGGCDGAVTVSTSSGYPVVTVAATSSAMAFALYVY